MSKVYCATLFFLRETNVWGEGAIKYGKKGKYNVKDTGDKMFDISGEHELNPEILFNASVGEERMINYLREYNFTGPLHRVIRKNKECDLSFINPLMKNKEQTDERNKIWNECTDVDVLATFNKDDIVDEVERMNSLFPDNNKNRCSISIQIKKDTC